MALKRGQFTEDQSGSKAELRKRIGKMLMLDEGAVARLLAEGAAAGKSGLTGGGGEEEEEDLLADLQKQLGGSGASPLGVSAAEGTSADVAAKLLLLLRSLNEPFPASSSRAAEAGFIYPAIGASLFHSSFEGTQQQDAQELLLALLETLDDKGLQRDMQALRASSHEKRGLQGLLMLGQEGRGGWEDRGDAAAAGTSNAIASKQQPLFQLSRKVDLHRAIAGSSTASVGTAAGAGASSDTAEAGEEGGLSKESSKSSSHGPRQAQSAASTAQSWRSAGPLLSPGSARASSSLLFHSVKLSPRGCASAMVRGSHSGGAGAGGGGGASPSSSSSPLQQQADSLYHSPSHSSLHPEGGSPSLLSSPHSFSSSSSSSAQSSTPALAPFPLSLLSNPFSCVIGQRIVCGACELAAAACERGAYKPLSELAAGGAGGAAAADLETDAVKASKEKAARIAAAKEKLRSGRKTQEEGGGKDSARSESKEQSTQEAAASLTGASAASAASSADSSRSAPSKSLFSTAAVLQRAEVPWVHESHTCLSLELPGSSGSLFEGSSGGTAGSDLSIYGCLDRFFADSSIGEYTCSSSECSHVPKNHYSVPLELRGQVPAGLGSGSSRSSSAALASLGIAALEAPPLGTAAVMEEAAAAAAFLAASAAAATGAAAGGKGKRVEEDRGVSAAANSSRPTPLAAVQALMVAQREEREGGQLSLRGGSAGSSFSSHPFPSSKALPASPAALAAAAALTALQQPAGLLPLLRLAPGAKLPNQARKELCLLRAPQLLVLHLKRLVPDPFGMLGVRKVTVPVKIEAELSLQRYLSGTREQWVRGRSRPSSSGTSCFADSTSVSSASHLFDIVAIVQHLGGPNSGHYVTYRRVPIPLATALGANGGQLAEGMGDGWFKRECSECRRLQLQREQQKMRKDAGGEGTDGSSVKCLHCVEADKQVAAGSSSSSPPLASISSQWVQTSDAYVSAISPNVSLSKPGSSGSNSSSDGGGKGGRGDAAASEGLEPETERLQSIHAVINSMTVRTGAYMLFYVRRDCRGGAGAGGAGGITGGSHAGAALATAAAPAAASSSSAVACSSSSLSSSFSWQLWLQHWLQSQAGSLCSMPRHDIRLFRMSNSLSLAGKCALLEDLMPPWSTIAGGGGGGKELAPLSASLAEGLVARALSLRRRPAAAGKGESVGLHLLASSPAGQALLQLLPERPTAALWRPQLAEDESLEQAASHAAAGGAGKPARQRRRSSAGREQGLDLASHETVVAAWLCTSPSQQLQLLLEDAAAEAAYWACESALAAGEAGAAVVGGGGGVGGASAVSMHHIQATFTWLLRAAWILTAACVDSAGRKAGGGASTAAGVSAGAGMDSGSISSSSSSLSELLSFLASIQEEEAGSAAKRSNHSSAALTAALQALCAQPIATHLLTVQVSPAAAAAVVGGAAARERLSLLQLLLHLILLRLGGRLLRLSPGSAEAVSSSSASALQLAWYSAR